MNCKQIQEYIVDFLSDNLNSRDRRRVEAHLAHCALCSREIQDISEMWTRLGVLPEVKPAPELRKRFYQRLKAHLPEESATETAVVHPGWLGRLFAGSPIPRLATLGLLLFIGFGLGLTIPKGFHRTETIHSLQQEMGRVKQMLAVSLLQQESSSYRIMGASQGADIPRPDTMLLEILLETVEKDENVNVRLAALDTLYRHRNHPLVRSRLTGSLAQQTSPLVQIALIGVLSELPGEEGTRAIRRLLAGKDLHPSVRQQGKTALDAIRPGGDPSGHRL